MIRLYVKTPEEFVCFIIIIIIIKTEYMQGHTIKTFNTNTSYMLIQKPVITHL